MELTLEEKTKYAAHRAREEAAELHFYDKAQPFFPLGFSIGYRNPGHWDIYAAQCPGKVEAFMSLDPKNFTSAKDGGRERAFRIRGEPGNVWVSDERWNPRREKREPPTFRSVMAAMLWICEEMMQEPARQSPQGIATDGGDANG